MLKDIRTRNIIQQRRPWYTVLLAALQNISFRSERIPIQTADQYTTQSVIIRAEMVYERRHGHITMAIAAKSSGRRNKWWRRATWLHWSYTWKLDWTISSLGGLRCLDCTNGTINFVSNQSQMQRNGNILIIDNYLYNKVSVKHTVACNVQGWS